MKQEWEGVVTVVVDDLFHANLVNITVGDEVADEVAEIYLSEISEYERSRVVPGAIFRWVIDKHGSTIRFIGASDLNVAENVPPLIFEEAP